MIVIIYGLCFIFTYLIPMNLFLRRLRILPGLKELNKLNSEPQYDKDRNIVSIKTNFSDFSGDFQKNIRKNHIFKILERICADIGEGKKYNPAVYLSLYKKNQYIFLGNLVLASHIAPLLTLIFSGFSVDNLFNALMSLQFVWYILIIAGQRLITKKYYLFTEIFYSTWYNKLLDFDAFSINSLKEKLFSETYFFTLDEINKTLLQMNNTFNESINMLLLSNEKNSSVIEKFTEKLEKNDLITAESIVVSLEDKIKRFKIICEQLENSASLSKESYNYLSKYIENNKIDINAITALANEFSNLRNTFARYTNTTETAAIEKLSNITSTFENKINKTFGTIEETLKENAAALTKSYDHFFEICKLLVENQEKGNI